MTEVCAYALCDLAAGHGTTDGGALTRGEVAAVRRRLRSLGYLED